MKGIIFNEFLTMVEERFDAETVEHIIEDVNLESGAAYTNVGTYDHVEIFQLVGALSQRSGIEASDLVREFGRFLFHSFADKHKDMLGGYTTGFELLEAIHNHIHVQVRKLYSNAELPHFSTEQVNPSHLKMTYQSSRKMSDLAEGLILETMTHFKHKFRVEKKFIKEDGSEVMFDIFLVSQEE